MYVRAASAHGANPAEELGLGMGIGFRIGARRKTQGDAGKRPGRTIPPASRSDHESRLEAAPGALATVVAGEILLAPG